MVSTWQGTLAGPWAGPVICSSECMCVSERGAGSGTMIMQLGMLAGPVMQVGAKTRVGEGVTQCYTGGKAAASCASNTTGCAILSRPATTDSTVGPHFPPAIARDAQGRERTQPYREVRCCPRTCTLQGAAPVLPTLWENDWSSSGHSAIIHQSYACHI